jgi:hypothetical protein
MSLDFKRVFEASKLIIGIGSAFLVLGFIFDVVVRLITAGSSIPVVGIAAALVGMLLWFLGTGYALLLFPIFFALYFYAGYRAVREFGMDGLQAGAVCAFSHLSCSLMHFVLNTLLIVVGIGTGLVSGGLGGGLSQDGSLQDAVSGAMLGGAFAGGGGAAAALFNVFCSAAIVPLGMILNFCIGYGAAWLSKR